MHQGPGTPSIMYVIHPRWERQHTVEDGLIKPRILHQDSVVWGPYTRRKNWGLLLPLGLSPIPRFLVRADKYWEFVVRLGLEPLDKKH